MSNDPPAVHGAEDPEPVTERQATQSAPPVALRVGGALVVTEGAATTVLAVVEALSISGDHPAVGVTTAVFLLVYGAGLVLAGVGLSRAAGWSRGPVVLAQLLQLGVAWSFRGGATTWLSVLLGAVAVGVLGAVFRRSSTQALTAHD